MIEVSFSGNVVFLNGGKGKSDMNTDRNRTACAGAISLVCFTVFGGTVTGVQAADRYWVAPLIGTWADASNWSLSSGGPGGQGLPQGADQIYMDQRSIAIFSGAGVPNANFASLTMSGAASGNAVTQLNMGSGAMGIADLLIGEQAARCQLLVTNAQLVSDNIVVGFGSSTTSATLGLNGSGLIDSLAMDVATSGANGSVELDAGTLRVVDLAIGVDQFNLDLNKVGTLDMTGGILDVGTLTVGQRGDAILTQTGGAITADTYLIGTTAHPISISPQEGILSDERSEHLGGTVEADTIVVGRNEPSGVVSLAIGQMIIDGSDLTTNVLIVGDIDATGKLELHTGSLDTNFAVIGQERADGNTYRAEMLQTGGSFSSATLELGSRSLTPGPSTVLPVIAEYEMFGGTSDHGIVHFGEGEQADAELHVGGDAVFTAETTFFAEDEDAYAFLIVSDNGTFDCDSMVIGESSPSFYGKGSTRIVIAGGTLRTDALIMRQFQESMLIQQSGGVFSARVVEAVGDADYFGGVTAVGSIVDGYYKTTSFLLNPVNMHIRDGADFRTPDFRHDAGMLTIGPGNPTISGPLLGPPFNLRTTGEMRLGSGTTVTARAGAQIQMNVLNQSVLTILQDGHMPVEGTFRNTNTIMLDEGTLSCTMPVEHDFGTIEGVGTIDADLDTNATLAPTIMTVTGSLACGPDSVSLFQLGSIGSTTLDVQGPSVMLDGEIRLDFVTGAAQPLPGMEYDIISTPNTTATGEFSSVVFEGASVPAELVYEPGRVAVRVLYCSRADLAAPYGMIDFFDISAFISLYQSQDPVIDLAAPFGQIDFFDVSAFLSIYQMGCP